MKLFKKLKDFFFSKEDEVQGDIGDKVVEVDPSKIDMDNVNLTNKVCPACELGIAEEHKTKSWGGKRYHLICFRDLWKQAKKMM